MGGQVRQMLILKKGGNCTQLIYLICVTGVRKNYRFLGYYEYKSTVHRRFLHYIIIKLRTASKPSKKFDKSNPQGAV